MMFALGYIAGIATAAFLATVLAYFRRPIISTLARIETSVGNAGPRPKGFLFEPESEASIARQAHIRKNAERGQDTPIQELL